MEKKIGLTKDAGWQFGIRKTLPAPKETVWNFLFSEAGIYLWLKGANKEFSTLKTSSHIRTKWKLETWTNEATLQMRLISIADKTIIAFHIDKMLDENQREEARKYWNKVLNKIVQKLTEKATNN
jgi:uncharacterized protein YndB with AHSA1/START domain